MKVRRETDRTARAIARFLIASAAVVALYFTPFEGGWSARILIVAACVIVPLGLRVVSLERLGNGVNRLGRIARIVQFPAAIVLAYALLLPQGWIAATFAVPYLAATCVVAAWGLLRAWRHRHGIVGGLCVDAGMVYLVIGASWAVLDRTGLRPLGFDPAIIILTAVHFHYAGFTLLLLTGLAAKLDHRLSQVNCIAVVIAVPLVALGITATQLGFGPAVECMAAWVMATGGLLTAIQYVRLAQETRWTAFMRSCWCVVAASLVFSMWLAALYGSRAFVPISWLDIPWMRALHGTANCVGVAFVGVLGWNAAARCLVVRRRKARLRSRRWIVGTRK